LETYNDVFEKRLSVRAERFDVDAIAEYDLFLSIGEDAFRFAVIDASNKQCLYLEDYAFFKKLSKEELIAVLNRIYENHLFLKANYWNNIRAAFRNTPFTLVPNELFDSKANRKYLRWISPPLPNEEVCATPQQVIDAHTLFKAPKELVLWLENIAYPSRQVQFSHAVCSFLEGIFKYDYNATPVQFHVAVEANQFFIAVTQGSTLEYCNMFQYRTAQDFIYYLLFVIDELKRDPATCHVNFLGQINRQSKVYDIAYRYIKHLHFHERPALGITFDHNFDNVPSYQYFNLLAMHLL
jgi:hypothetical protein